MATKSASNGKSIAKAKDHTSGVAAKGPMSSSTGHTAKVASKGPMSSGKGKANSADAKK